MKQNILKFGNKQSIKRFITFNILLLLLNAPYTTAETILHIGSMQLHEKTITKKILKSVYQRLNIKIEFVNLPAERSLSASNQGILDGEDSRMAGLEHSYANLIRINIPIETVNLFVYSKNKYLIIQGWQSLKPYRIAYLRGVKIIEKNLIGFNTESITDIKQAFMMLEHDRVDIVVADDFQSKDILSDFKNIKKLEPAVYSFPVFHYLNKKHINLIPKLESVLSDMIKDSTLPKIIQESK